MWIIGKLDEVMNIVKGDQKRCIHMELSIYKRPLTSKISIFKHHMSIKLRRWRAHVFVFVYMFVIL